MMRGQSHIRVVVLLLLLVASRARVMEAHDAVVGDWIVRIKCERDFFSSILFPPTQVQSAPAFNSGRLLPRSGIFKLAQGFPCQLSIFSNGTFIMQPSERQQQKSLLNGQGDNSLADNKSILPLRGQWQVQANPYCITDRFYDQLNLKPFPRKLVARPGARSHPSLLREMLKHFGIYLQRDDELVLQQRLLLSMHCRISGRYASPGAFLKDGRGKATTARLTHGMLVWQSNGIQREELSGSVRSRRRQHVGASFCGHKRLQKGFVAE